MITRDTNILEAVQKYPVIAQVFQRYGLGCIGCMVASGETLGEGISAHGLNADIVIAEINDILKKDEA
jgi:hybrid cluster-associated redox disulfide protein